MKKAALIITTSLLIGMTGCSDASMSAFSALGRKHIVTLYACDGKVIGTWETSGKIENEGQSNGYYFNDDKTNKLVMVDGTLVITVE